MEQSGAQEGGKGNNGEGSAKGEMKARRERDGFDDNEQRPEDNSAMREVMKCAKEV